MLSKFELSLDASKLRAQRIAEEQYELAHLNLEDEIFDGNLEDPFEGMTDHDFKNPGPYLMGLLMNPDYFGWTCKHLMGIDLLPMQCAILRELWFRPFPMLIGSRGFGKCESGDSIIYTKGGMFRLDELINPNSPVKEKINLNLNVLGENGYNFATYGWNNGWSQTIKLLSNKGFSLEGTLNHPIRVIDADNIVWKNLEDIKIGDIIPICTNDYEFNNTSNYDKDFGWWIGATIGDGMTCQSNHIVFTNIDQDIVDNWISIGEKLSGKKVGCHNEEVKCHYAIYGIPFNKKVNEEWGLDYKKAHTKSIPKIIRTGSKLTVAGFLSGLMDTDGSCGKNGIEFTTVSEELAKQVQIILLCFGIIAKKRDVVVTTKGKKSKAYVVTITYTKGLNIFKDEIGFRCQRKQDILNKLCLRKTKTQVDLIPSSLIFNDVTNLKIKLKKYCNVGKIIRRPCFLKSKGITYEELNNILDLAKKFKLTKESEFLCLEDLYNKHYFYDKVVKLEQSESQTFDVHIPDDHSFISNGFISHNSYLLALYSLLRALFLPGRKIIITGAGFRQSKIIFGYAEAIWQSSPILRDICGVTYSKTQGIHHGTDLWHMDIGHSVIKAIPLGSGDKIRGQRANDIISDEFASIPRDVFESVVMGFAVVAQAPVERVKEQIRIKKLKELGMWNQDEKDKQEVLMGNQVILSGTASFAFNHFYEYWKKYKAIITSGGDSKKLRMAGAGEKTDHTAYSIIRIPVELVPKGFMDDEHVERARNTVNSSIYMNEYGATFSDDSNGFYKRSLIEHCTLSPANPIRTQNGESIEIFSATLSGRRDCRYIYGIDPASVQDNFSIVILEIHPDHARVVYCWTTNNENHKEQVEGRKGRKDKISNDFYAYCTRKIRDLMKIFPCAHIAMDAQGGGRTIAAALHNDQHMEQGELPIWEINESSPLWDSDERDTDDESGLHILQLIQFVNADYTYEANHGLKSDFEHQLILFPYYDAIEVFNAGMDDLKENRDFDTLEDVLAEIEELKTEICIIQHSQSDITHRERWGAPEIKAAGTGKKGLLHDDRYAAFVMANMAARQLRDKKQVETPKVIGGWVGQRGESKFISEGGPLYHAPSWVMEQMKGCKSYGKYVDRNQNV
jgi:hypothetical protein